ncbi:Phosphate ABC transporter, periplasmic phosphate-binding protein PstS (TC 3.A.1.7.1) [hydrothermal vent metagenome]|uniref:Phosphate ABC transporter, periplasmic phosphate-binding protein PstS (TC 3.A.1.7.1) n=1 Tax=hydrothermal vent metagenome TaxID=652676 RepID=A0A3B1DA36_9ZZZZ
MKRFLVSASICACLLVAGCGEKTTSSSENNLKGKVKIDGSSTVYPITNAVAEEFSKETPQVKVQVAFKGTGGGFKRFCKKETDINDASRPIKDKEKKLAAENGIEFIECPVGFDGISIVVNPKNTFLNDITVEELRKIWQPGSTVKKWSDVRKGFPNKEIKLYGPGSNSGTFDYFTKVINGKEGASRKDYSPSEDDNVLVTGIEGDENSLGYFGFAYYIENKDKLKLIPVNSGSGPIAPSMETIKSGAYKPLSRPIFIYISKESAERKEVDAFVTYYLNNATALVKDAGYIPFSEAIYDIVRARYKNRQTGSIFNGAKKGATVEEILNEAK